MSPAINYPLTTLHFEVQWDNKTSNFSEVSGLTMEAEIVEYRGGHDPALTTQKQPGLKKFGPVSMKRGIVPAESGSGLFDWFNTISAGNVERRDVSVSLLNENRQPVMTWKIQSAFPTKIEGPGLKSTGTDIALETLEFACENITVEVR